MTTVAAVWEPVRTLGEVAYWRRPLADGRRATVSRDPITHGWIWALWEATADGRPPVSRGGGRTVKEAKDRATAAARDRGWISGGDCR